MQVVSSPHTSLQQSAVNQTRQVFQTKSIVEIKKIEATTRSDIEQKKRELRAHIGDRYRDTIEAADSVFEVKGAVVKLQQSLVNLEDKLSTIKNNPHSKLRKQNEERQQKRKFYTFGKQVKLLVDTPEEIWFSLEIQSFNKATIQYLGAEATYKSLCHDSQMSILLKSVPLVEKQWEIISKFPQKITSASSQRLQVLDLSEKDYSHALSSNLFLGGRTPLPLFTDFLSSRRIALTHLLSFPDSTPSPTVVIDRLCSFVRNLKSTIHQIGCLFMFYPFSRKMFQKKNQDTPDHASTAAEKLSSSFDSEFEVSENGLFYSSLNFIIEKEKEYSKKEGRKYVSIEESTIQNLTFQWISSANQMLKTNNPLRFIETAKDLSSLETAIQNQINSPFNTEGSEDYFSWDEACHYVINNQFSIWESIFHPFMIERSEGIIYNRFHSLDLDSPLRKFRNQLTDSPENQKNLFFQQESHLNSFIWSGMDFGTNQKSLLSRKAQAITDASSQVILEFDKQLRIVMEDIQFLIQPRKELSPGQLLSKKQDIKHLSGKIQEICFSAVSKLYNSFHDEIRLIAKSDDAQKLTVYLLFLGRLGVGLQSHSKLLKDILIEMSPASSEHFKRSQLPMKTLQMLDKLSSPFKGAPSSGATNYEKLSKLATTGLFLVQIAWFASIKGQLIQKIKHDLVNTDWSDPMREKSWLAISIAQPEAGHAQEHVPFIPSEYILTFILGFCHQIQNNCGHTLEHSMIQYFIQQVSNAVMSTFHEFLANSDKSSYQSSLALIQFWFDAKFFCEVMVDRDIEDETLLSVLNENKEKIEEEESTHSAWMKTIDSLNQKIKANLDPIDVLFYEKRISLQARACYQRCHFLFGFLTMYNLRETDALKSSLLPNNIISMLPPVNRFKLLPVTEPTLLMEKETPTSPMPAREASRTTNQNQASITTSLWATLGGFLGEPTPAATTKSWF